MRVASFLLAISINQFICTAVAEKVSALATADYLEQRAQQGNRQEFRDVLSKVPDVGPGDFNSVDR